MDESVIQSILASTQDRRKLYGEPFQGHMMPSNIGSDYIARAQAGPLSHDYATQLLQQGSEMVGTEAGLLDEAQQPQVLNPQYSDLSGYLDYRPHFPTPDENLIRAFGMR